MGLSSEPAGAPDSAERAGTVVLYVAAMVAYIVITLFTKRLLTWNLAMLYFVVTLDLLPRLFRRLRAGGMKDVAEL